MGFDLNSVFKTFLACAQSIGTAMTLAGAGAYMHRRGFVHAEGKRLMALICLELTFPLFLFTKIICCEQNGSDEPCPSLMQSFGDAWALTVWPVFMVLSGACCCCGRRYICLECVSLSHLLSLSYSNGNQIQFNLHWAGIFVGMITVRLAKTPRHQHSPVVAAVTFANNAALPITLLSAVARVVGTAL